MSFAGLSAGWVLAGLAALAAVLLALQRLRVRHRELTVETTLFWQEAAEEARARVLMDRFRHPLAYLFVLLIASVLWLGVAAPRMESDDGRDHVLLLDASAGMARGTWLAASRERLLADAAWAPRDRTTVIVCAATPRTVLLPGENLLLLAQRLANVVAEACPETVTQTIRDLIHAPRSDRALAIRAYGAGYSGGLRLAAQAADVDVTVFAPQSPVAANSGVTALGVADAASGAWGAVDVLVEVTSTAGNAAHAPDVTLDGAALTPSSTVALGSGVRTVFRDVPAAGGTLTATVPGSGDAAALDDRASVVLPARRPIVVAVPADVPRALLAALRGDPAVRLTAAHEPADVTVTRDAGSTAPAIVLVAEDAQDDAFVVVTTGAGDADTMLQAALDELALTQIDATSLATEAGRAISLGVRTGDAPQVRVWETLLTARYDLVLQRAFPAFVARAVRRIAGAAEVTPVVAVGTTLPGALAPLTDPTGALLDPADGALRAVVGGPHVTAAGTPVHVALLDTAGTTATETEAVGDGDLVLPAPPDLVTWAALAGLVLLTAEWLLYRAGRLP